MESNKVIKMKNKLNTFEMFMNQYIVKYKNTKECFMCKNKITSNHIEKMENICPKMWKYFHGIINQPQCPLQRFFQKKKKKKKKIMINYGKL
ncbi:hypothetical protein PFMC_00093 [Plasmodium falciparum CAMP/Malaysia]|uniref:Uncharacterized protein n=1 Tax=Plasmodium falciparum (isolate Camp / Malaysia) TaxID=5835 RepID=A0A024XFP5_PLAFC|nr:hypothetical protein PFMC_00093 [Plasmodium falciparum CAMP/Malaysia]